MPNSTTALGAANDVAYAGYCSVCNNKGFTRGLARVFKDSSGTWGGKVVAAAGLPNRFLSGVHVDRKEPLHVVVAVNGFNRRFTEGPGSVTGRDDKGHLFESFDGGETFTSVDGTGSSGMPDVPADDVILSEDDRTALVATDLGVLRGTRDLASGPFRFTRLGAKGSLPAATVMDLSIGPDGVLYAATHSRGIFGYPLEDPTAFRPRAAGTTPTTGASPGRKK